MRKNKRFTKKTKRIHIAAVLGTAAAALLLVQLIPDRTTYVITDGSRVLVHATMEADPQIVLGEAGLELGADDRYTARTGDGVSQINIHRSQRLTVNYYGELMEVTSQGETVAELLTRLDLSWRSTDAISVPLNTRVYEGMEITVAQVIRQEQTYTTTLPHETTYCYDPSAPQGSENVLTRGIDGEARCTAMVTYVNGAEVQREILDQQVIFQPVSEVIALGYAEKEPQSQKSSAMAEIGDGIITLPTGEVLTYTEKITCLATAYHCEGYVGKTATGTRARVGAIAVDPEVFPYGTRFYIVTKDGEYVYGVATAEDCGDKRFIHDTRLDLFLDTKYECIQFGARNCDVYILG